MFEWCQQIGCFLSQRNPFHQQTKYSSANVNRSAASSSSSSPLPANTARLFSFSQSRSSPTVCCKKRPSADLCACLSFNLQPLFHPSMSTFSHHKPWENLIRTTSTPTDQNHPPCDADPDLLIADASRAYALGDLEAALACYERLVQIEPENAVLHANRSAIQLRMEGCQAEALEAADQAVQCAPDWPKAHFRRGEALMAVGRVDEALLANAEAVHLSGGEDSQFRLALVRAAEMSQQKTGGALLDGQLQFTDLEDDCCVLFAAIGDSFLQRQQFQPALKLLRYALQIESPTNAQHLSLAIWGQIVLAESKLTNWPRAVEALEKQLEIAVKTGDEQSQQRIHGALAELLASKMGKLSEAIGHKREQLRMADLQLFQAEDTVGQPLEEVRLQLAQLLLSNGNLQECQYIFKSTLQQEPMNCTALLGLGRALIASADFASANALFTRVEKLDSLTEEQRPFRLEAILLRAKCQLAKGEADKAWQTAQKLLHLGKGGNEAKIPKNLHVEFLGLISRCALTNCRPELALQWAKKLLAVGLELSNVTIQAEALQLLMQTYGHLGQWLNSSKVAAKLWEMVQQNTDADLMPSKSEAKLLEEIGHFWRVFGGVNSREEARKVFARRLGMFSSAEQQDMEWAVVAMDLAELELELGYQEICEQILAKVERILTEKAVEQEESDKAVMDIAVLQMKAELDWKRDGFTAQARAGMEQALMLAQERGLARREAWICTRLGEWTEANGSAEEEAMVYLRQAIGLGKRADLMRGVGWSGRLANARMLLRAFSALGRVLARKSLWEDAILALRSQLRLQRELEESAEQRLGTMLMLGEVLIEAGAIEATEKLLKRVKKRAKMMGADKELLTSVANLMAKCRLALIARNESRERDYVNLDGTGEVIDECEQDQEKKIAKRSRNKQKSYSKVKKEQQRRSFCGHESEQSDAESQNYWRNVGKESDTESTASGAFVLGIDMEDD